MSTAMIALNCLEYRDKLDYSRIFSIKVDPSETIGFLREEIWKKRSKWLNPDFTRIILYIPRTAVSKAEFNDTFEGLNLGEPKDRNSALEELDPAFDVGDYPYLKEATKKMLHVIVFLSEGKWR
jgi:hypothetical protein